MNQPQSKDLKVSDVILFASNYSSNDKPYIRGMCLKHWIGAFYYLVKKVKKIFHRRASFWAKDGGEESLKWTDKHCKQNQQQAPGKGDTGHDVFEWWLVGGTSLRDILNGKWRAEVNMDREECQSIV